MFLELENLFNKEIDYVINMPINQLVRNIQIVLNDYLLPEPSGLYINYLLEPVLNAKETYFYFDKNKNFLQLYSIEDEYRNNFKNIIFNKSSIYNKDYKMLLSYADIINKNNILSNNTFFPYRAIKVARLFLEKIICELVSYKRDNKFNYEIYDHVNKNLPFEQIEFILTPFYTLFRDYVISIETFHNRVYEVREHSQPYSLTIVRSLDWRAFEYERQILISKYNINTNINF